VGPDPHPAISVSSDTLIATDFDGTLSPMVMDPAAAAPLDGAVDTLVDLAGRCGEVAVVSGRPLSFLASVMPDGLTLVGLYGLEVRRHGELIDHPNSGVWRETMADVAVAAERNGPRGMRVESKGLSITLHYREHPELADEVDRYAATAAAAAGLSVRPARCSVELHPPIDEDKGTALLRLAAEHTGDVVYIGDDVGDHPAFDALDALSSQGRSVTRVVADSDETDPALRARADVVVDGPTGVLALLRSLTA
jgi:trehalose 6-phosphate phosphatase